MKVIIKKPELLSAEYLINNGKLNDVDVWLDTTGYVTTNFNGDTVPYCGIIYSLNSETGCKQIETYFICNTDGFPVTSVYFHSNGNLECYEDSYINPISKHICLKEQMCYRFDGTLSKYVKKFDDGMTRSFVFNDSTITKLEIFDDNSSQYPTVYEFYDKSNLKRYCFYDNSNVRRNISWNVDGLVIKDTIQYQGITEKFSFDETKYELSVYKNKNDIPILINQESESNKVVYSIYEYKLYPGTTMSVMKYSSDEMKYTGLIFGVDGTKICETSFDEVNGVRTVKMYESDGCLISDIILDKIQQIFLIIMNLYLNK